MGPSASGGLRQPDHLGVFPGRGAATRAGSNHRNTRYGVRRRGPFARPQEHPSSWTASAVPIAGGNAWVALTIAARHRPDHGSSAPLSACRCWVRWPGAPLAPDREPASRSLSVELPFAGRARPQHRLTRVPFNQGLPLSPVFVNDKDQTLNSQEEKHHGESTH